MGRLSGIFRGDRVIWVIYIALCLISLVEVFSATSTLTFGTGNYMSPIIHHARFLFAGLVIVLIVSHMPCYYFRAYFMPLGAIISVAMLLLLLLGFGVTLNEGTRWLKVPGTDITIQPSEIAKGVLITYIAYVLAMNQTDSGTTPQTFKLILVPSAVVCALILPNNLSTAAILFVVTLLFMFVGRVSLVSIGKTISVLLIAGLSGIYLLYSISDSAAQKLAKDVPVIGKRVNTWKNRIFDEDKTKVVTPEDFDIDKNSQVGHSCIAIASSNVLGKGPGNSQQRNSLPQAYSDFIYSIIVEEFGLVGAVVVVGLYVLLLFRVCYISRRFTDQAFPPFLAMGLALLIVVQAMVNMLVATDIGYVTGQPLPLISRGGTSTLINSMYIGMILSASRMSRKQRKLRASSSSVAPAAAAPIVAAAPPAEPAQSALPDDIPPAEQTAREIAAGNFDPVPTDDTPDK